MIKPSRNRRSERIGEDRVAKVALTGREKRQYVKRPFSHKIRNLRLIGDGRGVFWQTLFTKIYSATGKSHPDRVLLIGDGALRAEAERQ